MSSFLIKSRGVELAMASLEEVEDRPGTLAFNDNSKEIQMTLLQEHMLLKKKARLLANGELDEEKREKITIKLEPTLLELYRKAPTEVKDFARKAMRRALKSILFSYWLENWKPQGDSNCSSENVTINLTVYEITPSNNNQTEIKIKERLQPIVEDLRRLQKILESSSYSTPIQKKIINNVLENLDKILK